MAAKMVLRDAKAPLLLFRSSILAAARSTSPTVPSNGDLIQSLLIAKAQKPLSESAVHPAHCLYNFDSLKVQGGDLQSGFGLHARGTRRVVDSDADEDDDLDFDVDDGDFDSDDDDDSGDDGIDFDEVVVKKRS